MIVNDALASLHSLGPIASDRADALARVAMDGRRSVAIRRRAMETVGVVSKGCEAVPEILMRSLVSEEPSVVCGAIDGVIASGRHPQAFIGKVGELLGAGNDAVRIAAIRAVRAIGKHAEPLARQVVLRLSSEPNSQIFHRVVGVVVRMGQVAARCIVEAARHGDPRVWFVGPYVLRGMGNAACVALMEAFSVEKDRGCLLNLLRFMWQLGDIAGPLTPNLIATLPLAADEEIACRLVLALWSAGQRSDDVLTAFVRCVVERTDRAADTAARALRGAGVRAETMVLAAIEGASSDAAERLRSCLSREPLPGGGLLGKLMAIYEHKTFLRYLWVADSVAKSPGISLRKIATDLKARQKSGSLPGYVSVNLSSLVRAVATLQDSGIVHGDLIAKTQGRSGHLTPNGEFLARLVADCIRMNPRKAST